MQPLFPSLACSEWERLHDCITDRGQQCYCLLFIRSGRSRQ